MTKTRNTTWFALLVRRRRIELHLRISEIPGHGGPSYPTMSKVESGTGDLTSTTRARLDHVLHWTPGSSTRALAASIGSLADAMNALVDNTPTPQLPPRPPTTGTVWTEPADRHGDTPTPPPTTAASGNESGLGAPQRDMGDDLQTAMPRRVLRQSRAVRTRTTLLTAAAHEFTTHGYVAASLSTILDTAGCTKGAMYFHFTSKQDLAHGVLDYAHHCYTTLAQRWLTAESAHPLDAIACLVDDIAHARTTHPILHAETRLALEPHFRDRRPSLIWESAVIRLAHSAADIGCLRDEFEPDALARAITTAVAGHSYLTDTAAPRDPAGVPAGTLQTRLDESTTTILTAMATRTYLHPAHPSPGS